MSTEALTGSRVREQRLNSGIRQADLARAVGISASYLNLIEHNRRRIGGKLMNAIARELGVDPQSLTEGAAAQLTVSLREAAEDHQSGSAILSDLETFARRHPDWAQLLVDVSARTRELRHTIEILSDRMVHDPFLSTAVHDVLSTVTAIRSTAAILVETPDIDPTWRDRFHRNLEEDAARLADSAEGLVRYLDAAADTEVSVSTPAEEFDNWLQASGFHQPALEDENSAKQVAKRLKRDTHLESAAARTLAARHIARYRSDSTRMPLDKLKRTLARVGCDPASLSSAFDCDLATVLRRMASLPPGFLGADLGLVACDRSGTLTFRKPIPGFDLPHHSAACPLWPLYTALTQPHVPVQQGVNSQGQRFIAFAICQSEGPVSFDGPPILEATMLIVPIDAMPRAVGGSVLPVGVSCRICPRANCAARREPAIVALQNAD
ncbi:MAG: short-chain fatty acyl-CoA regulator family protein [Pseudomonadota bacterium]